MRSERLALFAALVALSSACPEVMEAPNTDPPVDSSRHTGTLSGGGAGVTVASASRGDVDVGDVDDAQKQALDAMKAAGATAEQIKQVQDTYKASKSSLKAAAAGAADRTMPLTFLPGRGVESAFGLGDREETFINWVGAQALTAREFMAFRGEGKERFIAYEDDSKRWLVHVRKSSKRIAQIFFCGPNWRTPDGFGPGQSYPRYREKFGPVSKMAFAMVVHATKGIGFKDSHGIEELDDRGIRVRSRTYECVTVFAPWTGERIDFSDWSGR